MSLENAKMPSLKDKINSQDKSVVSEVVKAVKKAVSKKKK